ncbi:MAG TPA: ABC transporter permease [Lachnospiraceae bacterium]|nr:ABC transporter permease [Lachnospiraceae bacterium]
MAQVWEYIRIALMNIKSNKGRSFLTMLGIIIGISSVIMIISIGNGVKSGINEELNAIAGGQIYLYSYGQNDAGVMVDFDNDDLDAILDKVKNVRAVTPMFQLNGTASGRKGVFSCDASFGSSGLEYSSNDPIIKGRYFSDNDYYAGNRVCVITESGARTLFGNTNVIGMTMEVTIYGITQEFTIIGIRQNNASQMVTMMDTGSVSMETPMSVAGSGYGFYVDTFNSILLLSDGGENASQVAKDSVSLLESRHNVRGLNAIQVENFNDYMGEMNTILDYVTLFVVLVAAISLLVGGIGVMNIMLVSVTERTREIGIRKALGARTGSIMVQFLSESAIITLLGGLIGITIGILGAIGVCSLIDFTAKIEPSTILGATLFSSAVGIFFGIYPARKAAKLSPIEALRHE